MACGQPGDNGFRCAAMIKIRIIIFLVAFSFWLLLNFSLSPENLIAAVAAGLLVAYLTADLFNSQARILKGFGRYLWFLYYIPVFIWECVKANFDGAYRVIHPDLPMRPGIVKVRTKLKSDTAITLLANTLTLKPGTMTVDVDKESGFLYVHWVDVASQDVDKATECLVRRFENILERIFE
jgi:multicomponent Na+:H+ antiporter subunit E